MHINKSKALLFVIIFMLGFMPFVKSQAVYENVQNSVYEYLNRQAQNGNIVLDDMVRPLTRNQISQYLFELSVNYQKKKSILLPIEAKELDFYIKEYGLGIADGHLNEAKEKWLGKDVRGRLRFFSKIDSASTFKGKSKNIIQPFQFNVEPVLQGGLQYAGEKESIVFRAAGIQLWASLAKQFGFQMYNHRAN